MPNEEAELLPCGRIEDRRNTPTRVRFACDSRLPEQRESLTEALAPKRDEPALSPPPPFAGKRIVLLHGSEKKVIGGEVLRSPLRRHSNFCLKHFWLNGSDNCDRRHFVLKSENIRQVTLESVRPDVRARHRIDQLAP